MRSNNPSIVLLGVRGCGKTSLAIIAGISFGLRHIVADDHFFERTGQSAARYRKRNGSQKIHLSWFVTLKEVLSKHPYDCVIEWPNDYVGELALSLLREYRKDHPVILVHRDREAIGKYLQVSDLTKVAEIVTSLTPLYRSCSNYEFYNLDESSTPTPDGCRSNDCFDAEGNQLPRALRMKNIEKSFRQLVKHTWQLSSLAKGATNSYRRPSHTYLLRMPLDIILSPGFDSKWLDCGVDVIQLEIEMHEHKLDEAKKEQIARALSTITRKFEGPIIYHVIPYSTDLSEDLTLSYLDLVDFGFRLCFDFVTVQLRLAEHVLKELLLKSRSSRLIGEHFDGTLREAAWTDPGRKVLLNKADRLGFEVIRLTQPATSTRDNYDVLSFVLSTNRARDRSSLIAYNTGFLGQMSRCFNDTWTPITTNNLLMHCDKIVPDHDLRREITIAQHQNSLYASFVHHPLVYYVIGHDVSYSCSPVMHNAAYGFFGMPHQLHSRSMIDLNGLSQLIRDENFGGLTIAQPFKRALFSHASAMSSHAENIGAVNTILPVRNILDRTDGPSQSPWIDRNQAGSVHGMYGDNLDWVGMRQCIKQNLSPANVITPKSSALVIGAGSMARAAIYALLNMGVQHIALYNRTHSHALDLAQHFSTTRQHARSDSDANATDTQRRDIRVLDYRETEWFKDLAHPTMILVCIPAPQDTTAAQHFLLPNQWMQSPTGGVLVDMNYRPLITPILRQVWMQADRGWIAIDGLENLIEQATAQFEVFTGRKVPKYVMRTAALQHFLESSKDDIETSLYIERQISKWQT